MTKAKTKKPNPPHTRRRRRRPDTPRLLSPRLSPLEKLELACYRLVDASTAAHNASDLANVSRAHRRWVEADDLFKEAVHKVRVWRNDHRMRDEQRVEWDDEERGRALEERLQ